MSGADWLQLFGGFCEAGGLVTVGLGIIETRRAFTDRPGIMQKVASTFAAFVARLTGRRTSQTVQIEAASEINVAGKMYARVGFGFQGSLEDRVTRLQEIVQRHEDRLVELAQENDSMAESLRQEIRSLREALQASEQKLQERINVAAANGLTLETWGVALFILGVALTTWGGVIA